MALRVPISWLKDYVELTLSPEDLAERLTLAGLEVESVDEVGGFWEPNTLVVSEVIQVKPHPKADRLSLVEVTDGKNMYTVVTGAPNLRIWEEQEDLPSIKVPLALLGAAIIDVYGDEEKVIHLKSSVIRGVRSDGMLCSEKELGLGERHEGVLVLPDNAPLGADLKSYLGDHIIHFDIKGGFSHLMAILGIAREAAALTQQALDRKVIDLVDDFPGIVDEQPYFVRLEIEDAHKCPRYSAVLIHNVKVGPSPFFMQQRLLRCGMRPINNIVDITNYVMLEMGQPLHAFDYKLLKQRAGNNKPAIIVRRAKQGESMTTLDGVERQFDEEMLLITDSAGPIAIAGIMGGSETEVSQDTTSILLEAANFEFLNNRRTSQLLKLRTEASDRFGKRIDPELTLVAALRAARLMEQYAEGTIEDVMGDLYLKQPEEQTVELDPEYLRRLLGMDIDNQEIISILQSLEFEVKEGKTMQVKVPSHRMDIELPADLVEEVVRVYGYDRLQTTRISDTLPRPFNNRSLAGTEYIRDLLTSAGLDEIITYSLIDPKLEALLAGIEEPDLEQYLKVLNPLSKERTHLRRSLLPGALQTLKTNQNTHQRIALFEVGCVFLPQANQQLPNEPRRLSILLSGQRHFTGWYQEQNEPPMDFFDLKGVVESLLTGLHIQDVNWMKTQHPTYHPGRCAKVVVHGKPLGLMGELHPRLRQQFELHELPVALLEFDLDVLVEWWNEDYPMVPISNYEPIFEDLAFVVDEATPAELVGPLILRVGKPLLQKVRLFDVYHGDKIGKGKKSLAYALTYQSFERTLSDEDVAPVRNKIIDRVKKELNAELRS